MHVEYVHAVEPLVQALLNPLSDLHDAPERVVNAFQAVLKPLLRVQSLEQLHLHRNSQVVLNLVQQREQVILMQLPQNAVPPQLADARRQVF